MDISPGYVAAMLTSSSSMGVKDFTFDYAEAQRHTDIWRIMTDSSISCPRGGDCHKFELVSPILNGGHGLAEIDKVLSTLNTIPSVEIGKSMGFHVHIDVSQLSCDELVKVCQNFIKYEGAMDSFMPHSRREDVQVYCKSNKKAIAGPNPQALIANCKTKTQLADVMNPDRVRYFKLNLQNLVTGRQPTLEFRQHSGTSNVTKIKNWVRFCMAFVFNSAKFDTLLPLQMEVQDDETLFDTLMGHVINDRYLRDFYRMRRNELQNGKHSGGEKGACCEGCAARGQCTAKFLPASY